MKAMIDPNVRSVLLNLPASWLGLAA